MSSSHMLGVLAEIVISQHTTASDPGVLGRYVINKKVALQLSPLDFGEESVLPVLLMGDLHLPV